MSADVSVHLFNNRIYQEKVLLAYTIFLKENKIDPLISLLNECAVFLESNQELSEQLFWDKESIEDDLGILRGTIYYSPDYGKSSNQDQPQIANKVKWRYAKEILSSKIVRVMCVPYNGIVYPEQDMTHSRLISVLCQKSEWIGNLVTYKQKVLGGRLKFSIGESSDIFAKEDMKRFDQELEKSLPIEPLQIHKEYDNLRALVKLALDNPELSLVLTVH